MDFFQLKLFCTVSELHSFSKAAKALHLSQPAISTHIKNLEEYFQGQLFERTPQGVRLTEPGETFYGYAKQILNLENEMNQSMQIALKQEAKQICLGASTTMGNVSLPCAIYMFKEEFPEVNVKLEIANTKEIFQKLTTDEIDFGVIEGQVDTDAFCCTPILSDELVFIAPPSTSFPPPSISFPDDRLSLDDFLRHPLIIREQGSGTREVFEKALQKLGLAISDLNIVTEMTTLAAIKSAVGAGMGGAIVPHIAVRKEEYLKIFKVYSIAGLPMPIVYNLIYPCKKQLTFSVKRLIHYLSDPDERYLC